MSGIQFLPAKSTAKTPLVLLCGWTDGPARALMKYTLLYEQSFDVLLVPSSSFDFFSKRRIYSAFSSSLLDSSRIMKRPVILHCLSNGGCNTFRMVTDLIHSSHPSTKLNLTHIILDSAPGANKSPKSAAKALTTWIQQPWLKFLAKCAVFAYFGIVKSIYFLFTFGKSYQSPVALAEQKLLDYAKCPRLYFYSEIDDLIPFKDVEAHADEAERLGNPVRRVKWSHTPHVQHYRFDPERYTKEIQDFIGKSD